MKKLIFVIFAIAMCSNLNAQNLNESDVPDAVKTAFNSMYPNQDNIEWESQGAYFEGGVKIDGMVTSVLFDANGTVIQSESQISVSDLPKGVAEYVSKNLNTEEISEAAKITDSSGKITYEAEVNGSDYLFDSDGNLMYNTQQDSDSGNENDD